ncbi:MAG: hypothetical protein SOT07_09600 [Paludibacteraceae bacterium]|nr:hypothetical protein [Paludibacteraceae bacterium]
MDIEKEINMLMSDPLFANIKVPVSPLTSGERIQEKLQAINSFFEQFHREPSMEGNFEEKRLARSLAALRNTTTDAIKVFDIYNLL